jgi:hypothetical protein
MLTKEQIETWREVCQAAQTSCNWQAVVDLCDTALALYAELEKQKWHKYPDEKPPEPQKAKGFRYYVFIDYLVMVEDSVSETWATVISWQGEPYGFKTEGDEIITHWMPLPPTL